MHMGANMLSYISGAYLDAAVGCLLNSSWCFKADPALALSIAGFKAHADMMFCVAVQMTEAENANKEVAGDSDSEDDFEEGMGDIDVEKASGLTIEQ